MLCTRMTNFQKSISFILQSYSLPWLNSDCFNRTHITVNGEKLHYFVEEKEEELFYPETIPGNVNKALISIILIHNEGR